MRARWEGLIVLLALAPGTPALGLTTEVYTDRAAFAARLGSVVVVDFDDVDTAGTDPAPFAADRYAASAGMVITGEGGQYASRSFTFPSDFPPASGTFPVPDRRALVCDEPDAARRRRIYEPEAWPGPA